MATKIDALAAVPTNASGVSSSPLWWGTRLLVLGLLAFLACLGLRSYAQTAAAALTLWVIATWICRKAGFYLGAAIIGARIATVLVAAMIVEPHYLAATGADVEMYQALGKEIANSLWRYGTWPSSGEAWGTVTYVNFTGLCYFLFGSNPLIMEFISAGAGAVGSLLFYRGFRQYYGEASKALLLVFFWPSVIYWSSIEGKDPWSFLLLGLGFCGISSVFATNSRTGMGACLVAGIGLFFLRPHIAALYLGAIGFSLLFRSGSKAARKGLSRAISVVILLVSLTCAIFVQKMWTGPESATVEIPYQVSTRLEGLNTGGSAIEVPEFSNWTSMLAYIPVGAATVVFRPFPWEPGDSFLRISSIDQLGLTALMILLIFNAIAVLRKKRMAAILQDRFMLFLGAYCIGFVLLMLFVSGNLGTLVREKIQLFPCALCLVASLRLHCRYA